MSQAPSATEPSGPDSAWRLGHRPGLDGLRGVAILLVMADHSGIGPMKGAGASGVTIFFVLSGFLITTLLLEEDARSGRVSLRRFYWRRALRLLPALVALLAVVGILMFASGRAGEFAGDAVPTLFYFMNWMTVSGNNPGLLSHTWSLSIEEQFYLVWPVTFLGLLAFGRDRLRWVAVLLASLALVGIVLRVLVFGSPDDYHRAYFGTDTRMDALAIGCLVAIAFSRQPIRVPAVVMLALAAALPLILWTTNDESMATVGLAATAFVGAGLVAGAATGVGERVLGWRPLTAVGIISYGLYLWHRPVMKAFTDSGLSGVPWAVVLMFAISIALAVGSRRYVEESFLRLKDRYFSSAAGPPPASEAGRDEASRSRQGGTRSRR